MAAAPALACGSLAAKVQSDAVGASAMDTGSAHGLSVFSRFSISHILFIFHYLFVYIYDIFLNSQFIYYHFLFCFPPEFQFSGYGWNRKF